MSRESSFVSEQDPSETLDNCIAAVDFLGAAIDAIQNGGRGDIDGDAVALICMSVTDALHDVKEKFEKKEGAQ